MSSPIRRVSVLSTGAVAIRPEHVEATGAPTLWWLLTSRRWTAPRPINVYVVEHEDGLVLFDTGQDRASVTDPSYFPGGVIGWLYSRLARFRIGPEETLTASLARLGYDVADVRYAILSHLHQDHIGGLGELGSAEILVAADEWRSLQRPGAVMQGLMRRHIDLPGLRWRQISFGKGEHAKAHDLFGDKSMMLLPTPGHTPGSMSLLVTRNDGRPLLLMVGDLTYDVDLLRQGRVPGVGKAWELRSATQVVNSLWSKYPDLVVLPAHDPGAARRLESAEGRAPSHPGS